jgi:hypothetical protein
MSMNGMRPCPRPATRWNASRPCQPVKELSFRRMTGKALRACGFPVKGDAIDAAVVHRLIATLAEVPPSPIDELDAADWIAAFNVVQDFLVAAKSRTQSNSTSTSAPGGATSSTS